MKCILFLKDHLRGIIIIIIIVIFKKMSNETNSSSNHYRDDKCVSQNNWLDPNLLLLFSDKMTSFGNFNIQIGRGRGRPLSE